MWLGGKERPPNRVLGESRTGWRTGSSLPCVLVRAVLHFHFAFHHHPICCSVCLNPPPEARACRHPAPTHLLVHFLCWLCFPGRLCFELALKPAITRRYLMRPVVHGTVIFLINGIKREIADTDISSSSHPRLRQELGQPDLSAACHGCVH